MTPAMHAMQCKRTGSGSGRSTGPDMLSRDRCPAGWCLCPLLTRNQHARARIHPPAVPVLPLVSSLPCHPCKSSRCAWPHTAQRSGHNGSRSRLPVGAPPPQHSAGNGRTRCQPVTPERARPSRRRRGRRAATTCCMHCIVASGDVLLFVRLVCVWVSLDRQAAARHVQRQPVVCMRGIDACNCNAYAVRATCPSRAPAPRSIARGSEGGVPYRHGIVCAEIIVPI